MPKKRKDLDLDELIQRAAYQYQEDCNNLFEEYVSRLVAKTQQDEFEIRDWLRSLV